MTKEEYERLLKSDYWKGYSYSLIKERNFTCEDCGQKFLNGRHKLQVHHLVYRDVNPWSYNPDELVVLCDKCHKKRHGIIDEVPISDRASQGYYTKTYSYASDVKSEKPHSTPFTNSEKPAAEDRHTGDKTPGQTPLTNFLKNFNFKHIICALLLFVVLLICKDVLFKGQEHDAQTVSAQAQSKDSEQTDYEIDNDTEVNTTKQKEKKRNAQSELKKDTKSSTPDIQKEPTPQEESAQIAEELPELPNEEIAEKPLDKPIEQDTDINNEYSFIEEYERRAHADAVRHARKMGVSTEGSTIDILQRISHAEAIESAKKAGVSTEGSTIDILQRISHAEAVESAKKAGVSTEGSTVDILQRISHAEAVESAKKAGVSTEGSTVDILQRISHAEAVESAKKAGVSTEGSTVDILQRLHRQY